MGHFPSVHNTFGSVSSLPFSLDDTYSSPWPSSLLAHPDSMGALGTPHLPSDGSECELSVTRDTYTELAMADSSDSRQDRDALAQVSMAASPNAGSPPASPSLSTSLSWSAPPPPLPPVVMSAEVQLPPASIPPPDIRTHDAVEPSSVLPPYASVAPCVLWMGSFRSVHRLRSAIDHVSDITLKAALVDMHRTASKTISERVRTLQIAIYDALRSAGRKAKRRRHTLLGCAVDEDCKSIIQHMSAAERRVIIGSNGIFTSESVRAASTCSLAFYMLTVRIEDDFRTNPRFDRPRLTTTLHDFTTGWWTFLLGTCSCNSTCSSTSCIVIARRSGRGS